MPAGTRPELVLKAVQAFCREEFSLSHRYALALHTDEPHPHVHVVVKALTDQGQRLNIRKDTLRAWRIEFAKHLRALGVAANATSRSDRGNTQSWKRDGIYRAALRDDSSYERDRATKSTQSDKRRSDLDLARLKLKRSREGYYPGLENAGVDSEEKRPTEFSYGCGKVPRRNATASDRRGATHAHAR
jgi:hypothetical protein